MTGPLDKLANDAQGLTATEGLCRIPELLILHLRVVLEVPGRLDDVDAPAVLIAGELGSPDRGGDCQKVEGPCFQGPCK
jgi:hypothetical protein